MVKCGVPQGSILGPLLFLCYVNGMITIIDNVCKLLLYADDSTILFSHKNLEYISVKFDKVLEEYSDWLVDNNLSLLLRKTEHIHFGPKRKVSNKSQSTVTCNDHGIKCNNKLKYLGSDL